MVKAIINAILTILGFIFLFYVALGFLALIVFMGGHLI